MEKNSQDPKVIVLTPVRNEDWILEKFIWACSQFADAIIFLDQGSDDRTLEIIGQHENTIVFNNPNSEYDEAFRTRFLIGKARELFGTGNLLVALDADEIPTYPSLDKRLWENLKWQSPGTTILFSKPDLLSEPLRYIPSKADFPLAYVDDGAITQDRLIHNRRIPGSPDGSRYVCESIVVLHFARVRSNEYFARQAMYCVIENISASKNWRVRTLYYSPRAFLKMQQQQGQPVPREWVTGYSNNGVDINDFQSERFNRFHKKVLEYFTRHGSKRFWMDDIWWEDWAAAAAYFERTAGFTADTVQEPNALINAVRSILTWMVFKASLLRPILRR